MNILEVNLDDQVHKTLVLIARRWSVGSDHELAVDACGQVDVLANGEPQDVVVGGEREPEPSGVVADFFLVDELEGILGVGVDESDLLSLAKDKLEEKYSNRCDSESGNPGTSLKFTEFEISDFAKRKRISDDGAFLFPALASEEISSAFSTFSS